MKAIGPLVDAWLELDDAEARKFIKSLYLFKRQVGRGGWEIANDQATYATGLTKAEAERILNRYNKLADQMNPAAAMAHKRADSMTKKRRIEIATKAAIAMHKKNNHRLSIDGETVTKK